MPLSSEEIKHIAEQERALRAARDPAFNEAVLQACESYLAVAKEPHRSRQLYWWDRD